MIKRIADTKNKSAAEQKLAGVHGLRFLAAVMVLVFHLRDVAGIAPATRLDTNLGAGVRLFFVISAFSLMYSTARYMARPDWIKVFAIKRFFRIAPLYYVMIFATAFVGFYGPHGIFESILSFTFVFNFFPDNQGGIVWAGWTIGNEMIFYAMMPLIIGCVLGVRSSFWFLLVAAVIGLATLRAPVSAGISQLFALMTFPGQIQFFAAGISAYYIYLAVARHLSKGPSLRIQAILIVIVLIGLWSLITPRIELVPSFAELERNYLSCMLAFGALVIWQAWHPSWIFSNRFVVYWGERSYSIYLLHAPILILCRPFWNEIIFHMGSHFRYPAVAAAALTLVLSASWFTYRFIERPGMQLGTWLYGSRKDIPAQSRAAVIGEW